MRTYFYFDDLLLVNEHFQGSHILRRDYFERFPGHIPLGASWHLHKTPPTIYATAKAILLLCPRKPTVPLPDFWNLPPGRQEDTCQEIEAEISYFLFRWRRKGNTWSARETYY